MRLSPLLPLISRRSRRRARPALVPDPRDARRRAAEHDVSIIQARLLGVLRDRKPTINELAELLELDKSSTSGLVDRAERRGLVARIPSTLDRRSVHVALTRAG